MTVTSKIRRQGGAAVMTIPPALLKLLGTEIGAEMSLEIDNGNLIASPVHTRKKRYSLAELLEGADEMADLSVDAYAWDSAPRMGNEAL